MILKLTPLHLKLLIHCYCNPEEFSPWSDTAQEFLNDFVVQGVARRLDGNIFELTKLGEAWLNAIRSVPVPRIAYLDAQGREIDVVG